MAGKSKISPLIIALIVIGILACSLFIYFQIVRGMAPGEPEPQPPVAIDRPPIETPEPPEPEVPPLDASDEVVRSLAETLSDHPRLATWLAPDNLVRRFVASVVNVADDESPRPHLGFLEPRGTFRVTEDQGRLFVAASSYARYGPLVAVFSSLDTAAAIRLYHSLEPLFDQAYQELGYPGGDFGTVLLKAIDRVLATPIPDGRIAVKRRVKSYSFADPELEALPPVQKQLLRMGPDNARKIQNKLRVVRAALAPGG